MRGKQLKVYLHPDDHLAVYEYVQSELDSVLLRERASDPGDFQAGDATGGGAGRLICPRSMVGRLEPRYIEVRGEWVLDVQRNPVVEWWFSKLDNDFLYPGRFYCVPGASYSKSGDIQNAPEFSDMANRLFRWVRSRTLNFETEWGTEKVGPSAAEKLQTGSVGIRRNPPGSRI